MSKKAAARITPPVDKTAYDAKMILLAYKQAEKELADGTASSQTLQHFLKLGASRSEIELEQLKLQNRLLESKIDAAAAVAKIEDMYDGVVAAMRSYSMEYG